MLPSIFQQLVPGDPDAGGLQWEYPRRALKSPTPCIFVCVPPLSHV